MPLADILRNDLERYRYPDWLRNFSTETKFNRSEFFSSRTVYYPGSGVDGQPVKLCCLAHAAHAFVYVDYMFQRQEIEEIIDGLNPNERDFRGYQVEYREEVSETDLRPDGWTPHIERSELPHNPYGFVSNSFVPFALFVVLRREAKFNENHGPKRFAILFIGGDGHATFDALYCQSDNTPTPYLVVIQDHGFGGNYNKFGRGGILSRIADICNVIPAWQLVARNSNEWNGYDLIGPENAHPRSRRLFQRRGR